MKCLEAVSGMQFPWYLFSLLISFSSTHFNYFLMIVNKLQSLWLYCLFSDVNGLIVKVGDLAAAAGDGEWYDHLVSSCTNFIRTRASNSWTTWLTPSLVDCLLPVNCNSSPTQRQNNWKIHRN